MLCMQHEHCVPHCDRLRVRDGWAMGHGGWRAPQAAGECRRAGAPGLHCRPRRRAETRKAAGYSVLGPPIVRKTIWWGAGRVYVFAVGIAESLIKICVGVGEKWSYRNRKYIIVLGKYGNGRPLPAAPTSHKGRSVVNTLPGPQSSARLSACALTAK
eukprot:scaffold14625_cov125-Isochrysis_galbana.AAC.10